MCEVRPCVEVKFVAMGDALDVTELAARSASTHWRGPQKTECTKDTFDRKSLLSQRESFASGSGGSSGGGLGGESDGRAALHSPGPPYIHLGLTLVLHLISCQLEHLEHLRGG